MKYPTNTTYPLENHWDHNTQGDTEGIERHYFNQIYDLDDGDLHPEHNRYSEESETVGDAVAPRAMGPSRRRPFQNPEDRIQTAQTRKDKACLRCRMQKIRVLNAQFAIIYNLLIGTPVPPGPFRSKGNLFDLSKSLEFEGAEFALCSL